MDFLLHCKPKHKFLSISFKGSSQVDPPFLSVFISYSNLASLQDQLNLLSCGSFHWFFLCWPCAFAQFFPYLWNNNQTTSFSSLNHSSRTNCSKKFFPHPSSNPSDHHWPWLLPQHNLEMTEFISMVWLQSNFWLTSILMAQSHY